MIKTVIFDMDGILIDSVPLWRRAKREIFSELGFEIIEEEHNKTMGYTITETVSRWFELYLFENVSEREVIEKIENRIIELIEEEGKMISGIKEVVDFCYKNFVQIGLASSSSHKVIDTVLTKLNFKNYFQVVCSAQDESFGKPHPAVYITALEKLRVKYYDCLVIEDSFNGLLAAKAAKIKCIAIPNEFSIRDERFVIADYVANSLDFSSDIIKYIKKNV